MQYHDSGLDAFGVVGIVLQPRERQRLSHAMPAWDPIGTGSVPLELAVGAGWCVPFHRGEGGVFLAGVVTSL